MVPQRAQRRRERQDRLLFPRGRRWCKPARLTVKCDGVELVSRKKQIMTPGEMEKVTVEIPAGGDIEICAGQA